MNYTIEENNLTENVRIEDNKGLRYHLRINHGFNRDGSPFSTIINVYRDGREAHAGHANVLFRSSSDALLGDLIIHDEVPALNIIDRFYLLSHPFEPIRYRRRGLGTVLLKYIIDLARAKGVRTLHGSLTDQDLDSNPNLLNWYRKHGFAIEPPTRDEVDSAMYRACLYLDRS
jgi:hypothetical protein